MFENKSTSSSLASHTSHRIATAFGISYLYEMLSQTENLEFNLLSSLALQMVYSFSRCVTLILILTDFLKLAPLLTFSFVLIKTFFKILSVTLKFISFPIS